MNKLYKYINNILVFLNIKDDKHCKCCNSKPQQEDEEIKDYFKYLNLSNINE
jgi:hypothetical protein